MLDEEGQARLRRAGKRFHEADQERAMALRELKQTMADANGDSTPEEAAELTGLSAAATSQFFRE